MTTTVSAFNSMFKNFLMELHECFPDKGIGMYAAGFDLYVAADPKAALTAFMTAVAPHSQYILTKDPQLFEQEMDLAGCHLDMKTIYGDSATSDATREAIWRYLQTLFLLGMTIQSLDPAMLNSLESAAQNAAANMQATGQMDFGSLMSTMTQMLGSMDSLPNLGQLDFQK